MMISLKRLITRRRAAVLACAALVLCALGAVAFGQSEDRSRKLTVVPINKMDSSPTAEWRAFLVGVRHYRSEIRGLRYTFEDVKELKSRLIALGVKAENITMLYDGEVPDDIRPTRENIEEKFDEFLDSLDENSVAFCYLSGHGFNLLDESGDKNKQRSYFAPVDLRFDKKGLSRRESLLATSISINDMLDRLSESSAKFKWLNIDACCTLVGGFARAGELGDEEREPQFAIKDVPRGVILMQSCSDGESSYESINPEVARAKNLKENEDDNKEYRHGLFTKALLEALPDVTAKNLNPVADKDPDGKPDGTITLIELFDYVKKRVQDEASKFHNAQQTPRYTLNAESGLEDFKLLTRLPVYGVSYDNYESGSNLRDEALALKEKGEYDAALTRIQEARKKVPDFPGIEGEENEITRMRDGALAKDYYQKAKEQYERGEYESASNNIESALRLAPDVLDYQNLKSDADGKLSQMKREREESQKREEERKRKEAAAEAYKNAGLFYDEGVYDSALKYIKQAREGDPNNKEYQRLERSINDAIRLRDGRTDDTGSSSTTTRPSSAGSGNAQTSTSATKPETGTSNWKTVEIAGIKTKFRWCPPGEFTMGSPSSEKDRDDDEVQHKVKLTKGFWLCEVPVTVSAFRKFVNDTGYKTEAEKNGDKYNWQRPGFQEYSFEQTPSHPVVLVSWNDAQAYVDWVNKNYAPSGLKFKLPSEAHWEYACRAGSRTAYWWGDNPEDGQGKANVADASAKKKFSGWTCFSFDDGYTYTSPVGSFKANDWGLMDMTGNVWEWCQDWYGAYPSGTVTDPEGPKDGSIRVYRGGGWCSEPRYCRSANRNRYTPDDRSFILGFRLEMGDDK